MKKSIALLAALVPYCGAALMVLGASPSQAQTTIYRVPGPNGITLTDRPPSNVGQATAVRPGGKPLQTTQAALPFELRQAVDKYPVTLYSGEGCGPCASGRLLLQSRGVPFTELTISTQEDADALQRISGDRSLPLLTIGGQKIKGYSETEWSQFLSAANYPARSLLSSTYRNPPPKPLVAVQRPEAATAQAAPQAPADTDTITRAEAPPPAAPAPANPGGIRF